MSLLAHFPNTSLDQMPHLARQICEKAFPFTRIAFIAPMGGGKTTLIHHMCAYWKVAAIVASPTFSLIHTYPAHPKPIHHFDLFRVKDVEEATQIGFEEYMCSSQICLIEWADRFETIIPTPFLQVHIQIKVPDLRDITLSIVE